MTIFPLPVRNRILAFSSEASIQRLNVGRFCNTLALLTKCSVPVSMNGYLSFLWYFWYHCSIRWKRIYAMLYLLPYIILCSWPFQLRMWRNDGNFYFWSVIWYNRFSRRRRFYMHVKELKFWQFCNTSVNFWPYITAHARIRQFISFRWI